MSKIDIFINAQDYNNPKVEITKRKVKKTNWEKFLDCHELTDEQLIDKEYIKTLWENFQENRL